MADTSYQSYTELFPLIDDPANIFYSKLKQFFINLPHFTIHCKSKNRIIREMELSFFGITRKYKCKCDIRNLRDEDYGKAVYLQFEFRSEAKILTETTTNGEEIPVDWRKEYLYWKNPSWLIIDANDSILIKADKLYFRVGRVVKRNYDFSSYGHGNEFFGYDIEGSEYTDFDLDYKTAYRHSIGRRLVLYSENDPTISWNQEGILDDLVKWELYDIDSDNNYTLVDHSGLSIAQTGYSRYYSYLYGPAIDHPIKLISRYGAYSQDKGYAFVEVRDRDFCSPSEQPFFTMYKETEPFCNTRGYVPFLLSQYFSGIKVAKYNSSHPFYRETLLLALQYTLNMNVRILIAQYLYTNSIYDLFGHAIDLLQPSVKSILSNTIEHPNGCLMDLIKMDGYTQAYLWQLYYYGDVWNLVKNNYMATYNLSSYSTDPDNPDINLPIVQNSMPSSTLPSLRWYQRESVWLLCFWRFSSVYYYHGRTRQDGGAILEAKLGSLPSIIEDHIPASPQSRKILYVLFTKGNFLCTKNKDNESYPDGL